VFLGCAALSGMVLLTIFVGYLGEVLRLLLFFGGCALAPLFIAGLGIGVLRQQALRFLLGLGSIACWPIAWALANLVTTAMVEGTTTWMEGTTATALGLPAGTADIPPLSVSAPMIAWGVLLMFGALTLVACAFALCGLLGLPYALTKAFTAGARLVDGWAMAAPAPTVVGAGSAANVVASVNITASPGAGGCAARADSAARPFCAPVALDLPALRRLSSEPGEIPGSASAKVRASSAAATAPAERTRVAAWLRRPEAATRPAART
jgi:hypothetical protein